MAYGSTRCGDCNEEAPVYNRPLFWWMLWPCLGLGIAGLASALLI